MHSVSFCKAALLNNPKLLLLAATILALALPASAAAEKCPAKSFLAQVVAQNHEPPSLTLVIQVEMMRYSDKAIETCTSPVASYVTKTSYWQNLRIGSSCSVRVDDNGFIYHIEAARGDSTIHLFGSAESAL